MDYLLIRGRLQSMGWRKGHDWATSLSLFTFMHWRRKWQPTSVFLSGGLPSMGSHRVGHDWSDLAAAAAAAAANFWLESISIPTRELSKSLISLHGSTSWFHKTGLWKSSQWLPVCCWLSILWLPHHVRQFRFLCRAAVTTPEKAALLEEHFRTVAEGAFTQEKERETGSL